LSAIHVLPNEGGLQLVETPDNPAPLGGRVIALRARDGARLRAAVWTPRDARGTVVVLGGRGEFIEKYFEVIGELLARGFAVASLDWRGQGGSERALRNPRKGHVDDFALYQRDVQALVEQALTPFCPKPWYGLAHSMGAAIMLMVAHGGDCPFERLFLTSPMIDIYGVKYPRGARALARVLNAVGFGGAFAPGGGERGVEAMAIEGNVLTSDPDRLRRLISLTQAAPDLSVGWPTVSWVHAAFRIMGKLSQPNTPREITTPCLMIVAGDDRVTDTRAAERFGARLRAGRVIVLDDAQHEVLMERDSLRDQCWKAFDAFIPGAERTARARSAIEAGVASAS
jgi:lysophospholipase